MFPETAFRIYALRILELQDDAVSVIRDMDHPRGKLVLVGGGKERPLDAGRILREEPLITFPEGSVFRRRLELLLSSNEALYTDRFTVINSLGAMISNICAGIGYGYLPRSIVEPYLAGGAMMEYPLEDPYADLEIVFIYRRDHIMDAAFRLFLESLEQ